MDEGRQMQLVHKLRLPAASCALAVPIRSSVCRQTLMYRHPALPDDDCPMLWYDLTPHIHPLYGVSFDPDACYGPAPFAPVH